MLAGVKKLIRRTKSLPRRAAYVALALFIALGGIIWWRPHHAKALVDTFTSSGTWTVPANVYSATFEAWGGGGAGGGASTNSTGGGGGAGGQYAIKNNFTVNPGDAYAVTVATINASGTGNGTAGGDSGVVSPNSTQVVLAKGGAGGTANNGAGGTGTTTGGVGDTVFAGGNGAAGSASSGGGGGGAGSTGAGGNASGQTAGTGTSANGGSGGAGLPSGTSAGGNNGNIYGGGGGGAVKKTGSGTVGGAGAQGYVTVTYTVTPPSYTQTSYEFYDNADSTAPGAAHGANTNYTLASTGAQFRLRQLVKANVNLSSGTNISENTADTVWGEFSSITLGNDGFPRLAYYDRTNSNLKYMKCNNSSCTSSTITTIDSNAFAGNKPSLILGSDGFGRIAYIGSSNHLAFIQCTDDSCSTSNKNVVDSSVGANYTRMVLGNDGFARIAYQDSTNFHLKFAQCTNATCSTANVNTIDSTANSGSYTSIALGQDGLPRITEAIGSSSGFTYVNCTNITCTTSTTSSFDTSINISGTYIAIASDGFARIAYIDGTNGALKFALCTNSACSTSNISTVDSTIVPNSEIMALGPNGFARIAYSSSNSALKYAVCNNTACSVSSTSTVSSNITVNQGDYIGLTLDSNDYPYISYPNISDTKLLLLSPSEFFKLQYANQGAGCSSASYSDVTSSSAISYYDNSTPANAAAITYQSGTDPTDTGQTITAQTYQENPTPMYSPNSWGGSADAEWDFSLKDNGATGGTAYCFRLVQGDGTAFSTYSNYPVITTASSNSPPSSPTLTAPASGATNVSTTPAFSFSDTDPESDDIQFKINLFQSDCSTSVTTYDMASGQNGWATTFNGTAGSGLTYTSATAGSGVTFTPSSALSNSTTYCWSVSAKDPGGSNTTATSGTQSFTTAGTDTVNIGGGVNITGGTNVY